jgi:D-inositol-3-phosphate glycosyltransferase
VRTSGELGAFDDEVRRIAVLTVHSSPLAAPGVGDSGGMNVHVRALASQLARAGVASDIYTRATSVDDPPVVEVEPGVRVLHLAAGPLEPIPKQLLPRYLCAFLCSLLRAGERHGPYDLVHSHYWVSGWVARLARERWSSPVVHSFHTLGKVKNACLANGEEPEPPRRLAGEERVVATADCLLAATPYEARQLTELYGAQPTKVRVVPHGVDHSRFHPGDRAAARAALGVSRRHALAFVGRMQPLKGPDVAVRTLALLRRQRPDLDVELLVVGGPSGNGVGEPQRSAALAREEGVADRVRFLPAQPHDQLATVYHAADLLLVPSRSESFGLVALEAQACGTPVVAARVGGLSHAVGDGTTGLLLSGHDPAHWAAAVAELLSSPRRLAAMGTAAARFAGAHGWDLAATRLLDVYGQLLQSTRIPLLEQSG